MYDYYNFLNSNNCCTTGIVLCANFADYQSNWFKNGLKSLNAMQHYVKFN